MGLGLLEGDHRKADRHRLDHASRPRLAQRWQHEDVGGAQDRADVLPVILEMHARAESALADERLDPRRISRRAPIAPDEEKLRRLVDARKRLDEDVQSLPLDELSEKDDPHDACSSRRQRTLQGPRRVHAFGPEQIAGDDDAIRKRRLEQRLRVRAAVRDVCRDPSIRRIPRDVGACAAHDRNAAQPRGAAQRRAIPRIIQVDDVGPQASEADEPPRDVGEVEGQASPREHAARSGDRARAPPFGLAGERLGERPADRESGACGRCELGEIEHVVRRADAQIGAVHLDEDVEAPAVMDPTHARDLIAKPAVLAIGSIQR